MLQYDCTDPSAPGSGAYKDPGGAPLRTDSGQWLTARWELSDARFAGGQNHAADFRLYNGGDDLLVRALRVTRLAP